MNRLNKIILSFVLPFFCLLVSVSYALIPNQQGGSTITSSKNYAGYSASSCGPIVRNYVSNSSDESYKASFNSLIEAIINESGYTNWFFYSGNGYGSIYFFNPSDVKIIYNISRTDPSAQLAYITEGATYMYLTTQPNASSDFGNNFSFGTVTKTGYSNWGDISNLFYEGYTDIPNVILESNELIEDGTYFYKGTSSEEPDSPSFPSNQEIASAVQMFYNSVYQLPNTAFKDFVVLYDNITGLYTYIGHTRGNALGQVIVEPNGYYEGYNFDVQWWKFFLDEQNDSWYWQNLDSYFNYYVYTSDGTIENLNYVGKSNINGLIEKSGPWATANTVIVYSTNDYPVKYITFSDESPDPDIQTGIIQGDQYTYDENLDITDNQYNPLDNFISINYPSTLVGNADFDSFLNTFNENKDVLILPQNSNWVILANTSLFSHFSSFIIMCTLFIIIERIMRG